MKKVKEWLEDIKNKQFVIKEYYPSGNIRVVQRIKDDAIFHVGRQQCDVYFRIIEFSDDCIHVKIMFEIPGNKAGTLKCQINDIKLNDDGYKVDSLENIDFGLPTMTDPGTSLHYSD